MYLSTHLTLKYLDLTENKEISLNKKAKIFAHFEIKIFTFSLKKKHIFSLALSSGWLLMTMHLTSNYVRNRTQLLARAVWFQKMRIS